MLIHWLGIWVLEIPSICLTPVQSNTNHSIQFVRICSLRVLKLVTQSPKLISSSFCVSAFKIFVFSSPPLHYLRGKPQGTATLVHTLINCQIIKFMSAISLDLERFPNMRGCNAMKAITSRYVYPHKYTRQ